MNLSHRSVNDIMMNNDIKYCGCVPMVQEVAEAAAALEAASAQQLQECQAVVAATLATAERCVTAISSVSTCVTNACSMQVMCVFLRFSFGMSASTCHML